MKSDKVVGEVLLVGNPNTGKSTLFNTLTGSKAKIANYPGVTVDCQRGILQLPSGEKVQVVDLPGTYSLQPISEDEAVSVKGIFEGFSADVPSLVLAIVDATQLERHLYFVSQLKEEGIPFLLVISMMDRAIELGVCLDIQLLEERLEVPVCLVSVKNGSGLSLLKTKLEQALLKQKPQTVKRYPPLSNNVEYHYERVREWLLGMKLAPSSVSIDERLDNYFLHPVFGPFLLVLIFFTLFQALFSWSEPVIGLVEQAQDALRTWVLSFGSSHELVASLLANGIIAGVGSVLTFVPLIAILFFFLGVLEDSGYLARATFLLDRFMVKVGLPGRAFVPLLSGFACAVPAIMSTRVIASKKERLITILVTPLMSCSARLPVYGLLIAATFSAFPPLWGWFPVGALVMSLMYFMGVLVAFAMAFIFKQVLKGENAALILELPPYRIPQWRTLFQQIRIRIGVFVREAGTIILAMTIILWALFTFPLSKNVVVTPADKAIHLQQSYAGQIGKAIEPLIAPLGFDWKIGIGLLSSFAAREVMVSTLGVAYGLEQTEGDNPHSLRQAMAQDINPLTQKPVYTPAVALSLMVFFALSMQCLSTLAVTKRETKQLRWPLLQLGYMTFLAWFFSFTVYQVGTMMGF